MNSKIFIYTKNETGYIGTTIHFIFFKIAVQQNSLFISIALETIKKFIAARRPSFVLAVNSGDIEGRETGAAAVGVP
jgi:hypothetical protein